MPIEVRAGRVLLRALRPDELDRLVAERERSTAVVGATDREQLRRRIELSGKWNDGRLDLAIELDGALAGTLDVRSGRMMLPPGVAEFGIELWEDLRGTGVGTGVVRLLTDWLHEHGFPRVQATTDLRNAAMRRVLEKTGFAFEGTLRGFMPGGDRRADFAMYAHVVP
jgi:RimJ/RimL family protein N-acetyltransferase